MNYLDDLTVGMAVAGTHTISVTEEALLSFARQFDPQPFHLDHAAAQQSLFRGLAASGWHTAALTMRLIVGGELQLAGGVVGLGIDELRWPLPVRPGDTLRIVSEVLAIRSSKSRPDQGVVTVRITTFNQHDEVVQIMISNLLVPRRNAMHYP